jgi:hypothetical protein
MDAFGSNESPKSVQAKQGGAETTVSYYIDDNGAWFSPVQQNTRSVSRSKTGDSNRREVSEKVNPASLQKATWRQK